MCFDWGFGPDFQMANKRRHRVRMIATRICMIKVDELARLKWMFVGLAMPGNKILSDEEVTEDGYNRDQGGIIDKKFNALDEGICDVNDASSALDQYGGSKGAKSSMLRFEEGGDVDWPPIFSGCFQIRALPALEKYETLAAVGVASRDGATCHCCCRFHQMAVWKQNKGSHRLVAMPTRKRPTGKLRGTAATNVHSNSAKGTEIVRFLCFNTVAEMKRGFLVSSMFESGYLHQIEIKEHLNADSVIVKDAYGDGRHVSPEYHSDLPSSRYKSYLNLHSDICTKEGILKKGEVLPLLMTSLIRNPIFPSFDLRSTSVDVDILVEVCYRYADTARPKANRIRLRWGIDVISSAFEGQSAVSRQRMVYKAIWEELQSIVHAVDQMTTRTPTEAAAKK
ncbi:hypothetical protein TEA_029023 [Camellia sinensis var. sinensis]|uniref:Uncharacterized protein n=1 Tax=Camellia sinensis var. sinensis TaxID=542762 RepID=A0A4S4EG07_CAMSN|nr:hypothetical protein TEA_029023 [Camellia sinensis var. sinensis]